MGLNSTWDDSARANENVPALNEAWGYGVRPMRGVNLGGWLVLEPYVNPSFFSNYSLSQGIVDEWTLTEYVNQTQGMGAVKTLLETHYASWVTEQTFQEIAEAGLDHVRIPFGYWSAKGYDGDHFLHQIGWRYLLRGIEWARKYGLRVNVDLHGVPGSQNGWNHSGRQGWPWWLNGTHPDGYEYGNWSVALHSQLGEFFAQDRYKNIVTLYTLVNEPRMQLLDYNAVVNWTTYAYDAVRSAGYENTIVFSDGFLGIPLWKGVFPESRFPNLTLDVHQYTIFNVDNLAMSHSAKVGFACSFWASQMALSTNTSTGHGPTMIGEWSQADNDCTLYLNNVGVGSRWEGDFNAGYGAEAVLVPSCYDGQNCTCSYSNQDPANYDDAYKTLLLQYAEAQMEAFESNGGWGWMYWNWDTETMESSQWSYKKGRDNNMLPQLAYQRDFNCSAGIPNYVALGLPEGV
jgi:aryl-phospho-beta-D-glucosidase BglC (GH1 family)